MVGAVAGRAVAVPPAVVARQEPVEGLERVVVGARAELQDHEPRGRVRHEDRQEPVAARPASLGNEPPAGAGQVGEPALRPGPDGQPHVAVALRRTSSGRLGEDRAQGVPEPAEPARRGRRLVAHRLVRVDRRRRPR